MFSKFAVAFAATMAVFVAAGPVGYPSGDITNSCNSGPVQCCNAMYDSKSKEGNVLLGLVGVAVNAVTAQVGLECNPITAIGVGSGAQCTSQPVCCTGNHFDGLVAVGCSPVGVNA
ncbi:fungal hydrophobin [Agrocybe pediades]|nr:fungal hydrophobin [Agrocybe pediades]